MKITNLLNVPLWTSAALGGLTVAVLLYQAGVKIEGNEHIWDEPVLLITSIITMIVLVGLIMVPILIVKEEFAKLIGEKEKWETRTYPSLERDEHEYGLAYLYLREIDKGEASRQIPVSWKIGAGPQLILDLDDKGEVLGIEFLDAGTQLGGEGRENDADGLEDLPRV